MDDFVVSNLHESKNEWSSRLLTILTPLVIEGLKSIFEEALKLCKDNNELDKYLMTFQNFISRIPKWNAGIIETERKRIVEKSGCGYLEDLVTCVHIIQLKLLSAMRVGQKQKKIDVNIPKLDDFIHKVYVMVARKIYKNVYLFEIGIPPLQTQKNYREMEVIIQECILNTVRESIPVESILRAYMDETVEEEVIEEIKEEILPPSDMSDITEELKPHVVKEEDDIVPTLVQANNDSNNRLSFNDTDFARDENNQEETIEAPKTVERLEQISNERYAQRKLESEEDDDNVKLTIFDDQPISLDSLDVQNISTPEISLLPDLLLDDIEVLG
jgi:Family of unknown function (DUF5764)